MNMVDRLLKADIVNKLAERPEKKVKMERLSKLFGFDFIITLRAIDPERYADIQKMAVDFTNGAPTTSTFIRCRPRRSWRGLPTRTSRTRI